MIGRAKLTTMGANVTRERVVERRLVHDVQLRASSDGRMLVGYAAVFNSLSDDLGGFRERIAPGAFSKTLAESADVRLLVNHDPSMLLARTASGTLRLDEDDHGLRVEADLPATSGARDLGVLLRRGDIDQMSFGFSVVKDDWADEDDGVRVRTLREVRLYDVSVATFPAYAATSADVRCAVAPHTTPAANGDHAWDANAALGRVRAWAGAQGGTTPEYGAAFAFRGATWDEHGFLHHDIIDGALACVPDALDAAAAELTPDTDAGVRDHLAHHYRNLGRVPPWDFDRVLEILGDADRRPEVFALHVRRAPDEATRARVATAVRALTTPEPDAETEPVAIATTPNGNHSMRLATARARLRLVDY